LESYCPETHTGPIAVPGPLKWSVMKLTMTTIKASGYRRIIWTLLILSVSSFWATVCKTVRLMLSDRCSVLSVCLSVTLLYCGQTVGWIKMKLGVEVGLGPGDFVLDEDPSLPPKKVQHFPQFSAHVCCGQTVAHLSCC